MYRWQQLNLFAAVTIPECAVGLSNNFIYTWKYYESAVLSPIKSVSQNQRYFKLNAYALERSTIYTAFVSVASSSDRSSELSRASTVIQVGSSGVVAILAGGGTQTIGLSSTITLDATGSYDVDYPTSPSLLSYTWSCTEQSPDFGEDCVINLLNISTQSFTALSLSKNNTQINESTYLFTLVVTNNLLEIASTAKTITVIREQIPQASFGDISEKYNTETSIILTATIIAPGKSGICSWSASTALTSIVSTPLSRSFEPGTTVYQLYINPNSLVAGLSYTFTLQTSYAKSTTTGSSSVTILMNAPPVDGVVIVDPRTGTALNTSFFILTSQWADDDTDLPLSYVISYYTFRSTLQTVIKNIDTTSYVTAQLGQGQEYMNYNVTCMVNASDIFGSVATAVAVVQVLPLSVRSLSFTTTSGITNALESSQPEVVSQIVGAVVNSINAVNCSVLKRCIHLNREDCSSVANTCGPCLDGYIGEDGEANSHCIYQTKLNKRALGLRLGIDVLDRRFLQSACDDDTSCLSGKCTNNTCEDTAKSCPADCSGRGICEYFDANFDQLDYCSAYDSFCSAQCSCDSGYYGLSCQLNIDQFETVKSVRESLCAGLYSTLGMQDVSSDVLISWANAVSSILLDGNQVSDAAAINCTSVLIETINAYPAIAGQTAVAVQSINAFSNVLNKGPALSPGLVSNVTKTLSTLLTALQNDMAIDQTPQTISTTNIRTSSLVVDGSNASEYLSPPQTAAESYLNVPSTSIAVSRNNSAGSLGINMVQYTKNFRNYISDSVSIGLQFVEYDDSIRISRGIKQSLATIDSLIIFQNIKSIDYTAEIPYNGTVSCKMTGNAYNVSVLCNFNSTLNFTCPGNQRRSFVYECPLKTLEPKCRSWNGVEFSIDPTCSVISYTSGSTTCSCQSNSASTSRRLQSSSDGLTEFVTNGEIVGESFVRTLSSASDLSLSSISRNLVIFITTLVVLILTFLGLAWFVHIDLNENKETKSKKIRQAYKFDIFLKVAVPPEFNDSPW
jgi:hypothetical protein